MNLAYIALRVCLITLFFAFFANLYWQWLDPTFATVAFLLIFFAGVALNRRRWSRES